MHILMAGCNHRTASVALRERLSFSPEQIEQFGRTFCAQYPHAEIIILSTCNRMELYIARPVHNYPKAGQLAGLLADFHDLDLDEVETGLYLHEDIEAVAHLCRVAASLDSMVLGEPQILGQVKQALAIADQAGTAGTFLRQCFIRAIDAGKEIRHATAIGEGRLSIGSVATDFAGRIFDRFDNKVVLGIGAGKMGSITLRHLAARQPRQILVTNRTEQRAATLADEIGAQSVPFDNLHDHLAEADIVVNCVSADTPLLTRDDIATVMKRRRWHPMFMLDLAVPRGIDPAVGNLSHVYLYNVDDLQEVIQSSLAQRGEHVAACEQIISRHVEGFVIWRNKQVVSPVITDLQQHIESIRDSELAWLMPKLGDLDERQRQLIEQLATRIIKKILHRPVTTLAEKAANGKARVHAELIRTLFGLDHHGGTSDTIDDTTAPPTRDDDSPQ